MNARPIFATFALCAACTTAASAPLSGRVVDVIDGDTIVVREDGGAKHRVRISGIDAPEPGQEHSKSTVRRVESLTVGRSVIVEKVGEDADGTIAGRVRVNGADIAERLIEEGAAWHDSERVKEQTPSERKEYSEAQQEAQESREGLWEEDNPTPPWEERKD